MITGIWFVICIIMSIMDIGLIFNINRAPCLKCGIASDVGAALVTGGSSLVSGIFGYDSASQSIKENAYQAELNRQFNREESQKNRDWQSEEARIARDWQSSQWDYQFGKENAEWYNRFKSQNKEWYRQQDYSNSQAFQYWLRQQQYNSIGSQIQRGLEAGVNPAAALGQAYGSSGLSAAPTSVASPAVQSPSMPAAPMPSSSPAAFSGGNVVNANSKADAFAKMASGLSDIAKAVTTGSKDLAQSKTDNALRQALVEGAILDNTNKQLLNSWQETINAFESKAVPKKLQKLQGEVNSLYASALLAQTQEELAQCQIVSEQFRQDILGKELDLKGQELIVATAWASNVDNEIKLKMDMLKEQAKTEKAKQSESYAASFKMRAEGKTEEQLRPLKENLLKAQEYLVNAQANGVHNDNLLKQETFRARVNTVIEQARQAKLITAQEAEALRKAANENHVFYIDRAFTWLGQGVGAFRDFGIGASALRGFPSKGSFDPDAGKGFIMDSETGLLFKAPWN